MPYTGVMNRPNPIDQLGGPTAVARMCGVKPPSVLEWRKRGIPQERCPDIERATAGQWRCEQLRPDVVWVRVPDPLWPHADGRPCIDVSAMSPTPARPAPDALPPAAGQDAELVKEG